MKKPIAEDAEVAEVRREKKKDMAYLNFPLST
jgi:hypothetical protein